MYSISFPNIFASSRTNLIKDKEAIKQNIRLTLLSDRLSLYGDPYFGSILKKLIFEQGDSILRDIVIDEIYTCLNIFIPQIVIDRKDISLNIKNNTVFIDMKYYYITDKTSDMYQIELLNIDE